MSLFRVVQVEKSCIVRAYLSRAAMTGQYVTSDIIFSATTTPTDLTNALQANLEAKRRTLLGPPSGTQMLCFVDDINMPRGEDASEMVRQLIDSGGFYSTPKNEFKHVKDVAFIASCLPDREKLPPRLPRHFFALRKLLSSSSMRRIFGTILNGYFDVGMDAFINASVHLLSSISVSLKPTPSKSHYAFNMRDIGRCVQGMLLGRALDEKQYGALWAHEHFRVFRDRLTTAQDEAFFDEAMQKVSEKYLGAFSVPQYDDAPIFDFEMSPVRDQEKVRLELEEALESHNITSPDSQMDLVFFQYAVHHIMRIGRVLKMARGHAVLVGVGGSGRQSLTRLAAHILGLNFYRAGKMKESILSAGCDDKVCVLFLTEADMRENIVAVNMLLTAGDIPGMFAPE